MRMNLMKLLTIAAVAGPMALASLAPAFAGSAGAADSRGLVRPQEGGGHLQNGGGRQDGGGRHNGGGWQGGGGHDGGWREGDRRHDHGDRRHEGGGGWGWAPFVFGGLAAGAVIADTAPPYDGDPCYQLRPTYDQWNNYVGRQWVNACE